ncbi:hypothetical protein HPB51_025347 [Rhipicephalus microplus]|uniref:Uncharacterized protein n=1 Tax=Rhipicephalus microplus TaxID=6941 RepID=A0A9J6DDY3_RHIMP|nr:hypothetical protein HPB51_025347 [Rhipicephalus microplus]
MTLLRKLATEKEVSGSSQSVGTTTAAVEWARFKPRATAAAAAARLHTTGRRPYLGGWSVPSLRPLAGEAFALRPHQPREGGRERRQAVAPSLSALRKRKKSVLQQASSAGDHVFSLAGTVDVRGLAVMLRRFFPTRHHGQDAEQARKGVACHSLRTFCAAIQARARENGDIADESFRSGRLRVTGRASRGAARAAAASTMRGEGKQKNSQRGWAPLIRAAVTSKRGPPTGDTGRHSRQLFSLSPLVVGRSSSAVLRILLPR